MRVKYTAYRKCQEESSSVMDTNSMIAASKGAVLSVRTSLSMLDRVTSTLCEKRSSLCWTSTSLPSIGSYPYDSGITTLLPILCLLLQRQFHAVVNLCKPISQNFISKVERQYFTTSDSIPIISPLTIKVTALLRGYVTLWFTSTQIRSMTWFSRDVVYL